MKFSGLTIAAHCVKPTCWSCMLLLYLHSLWHMKEEGRASIPCSWFLPSTPLHEEPHPAVTILRFLLSWLLCCRLLHFWKALLSGCSTKLIQLIQDHPVGSNSAAVYWLELVKGNAFVLHQPPCINLLWNFLSPTKQKPTSRGSLRTHSTILPALNTTVLQFYKSHCH